MIFVRLAKKKIQGEKAHFMPNEPLKRVGYDPISNY